MISLGEDVTDKIASDIVKKESLDSEIHGPPPHQTPNNGLFPLQSDHKGRALSIIPEKVPQVPVPASESNQQGSVSTLASDRAPQTPDTAGIALRSGQEGITPSTPRERALEDGYNWRKYGQKYVKGNAYVRSYYRCTHTKCPVKRQVERTHNGQITDTVYFGEHDHPRVQVSVPVAVSFIVSLEEKQEESLPSGVEDKSMDAHGHTSNQIQPLEPPQLSNVADNERAQSVLSQSKRPRDGDPDSKRQKKEKHNGNSLRLDKPASDPRIVVQTMSEVDIVNDGYRWRKYGQKVVKNNPNPRSYYRCSSPGCSVKKHIERATHDSKVVIASYEGQHDHDMPTTRTVNAAASNVFTTARNGQSGTASEGNDILDDTIPEPEYKSVKQLNGESRTKSELTDGAGCGMVVDYDLGSERRLNEQLIGKACTKEESEPPDMTVNRENELQDGESGIKLEGHDACMDTVVQDSLCPPESEPPEQEKTVKAEPL